MMAVKIQLPGAGRGRRAQKRNVVIGGDETSFAGIFGQVIIGAYKLATMIKVSEELLNDSVFNLEQYIAKEFARRIGAKEEEAFFVGNGTGKPTGRTGGG